MGPESAIEASVCKWARENGILVLKLNARGGLQAGQPDRMFLKNGRVAFIEFKAERQRPRALQARWLERLRDQGFPAVWGWDKDELVLWLKHQLLNGNV